MDGWMDGWMGGWIDGSDEKELKCSQKIQTKYKYSPKFK